MLDKGIALLVQIISFLHPDLSNLSLWKCDAELKENFATQVTNRKVYG